MTRIIAHRGDSAALPENTMAAFQSALDKGAEGIETDVHMTADGVLVLCHDEVLGRTVEGSETLGKLTWRELQKRDCGSWFDSRFHGERVPRLEDLMDLMEPHDLLLNLEIKGGNELYPGMEDRLLTLVSERKWQHRLLLSSFNHLSLQRIRQRREHQALGVLTASLMVSPWSYVRKLKAQAYHPHYRSLLPFHIRSFRRADLQLNPYTVDRKKDLQRMFHWGVDHVITNVPGEALLLRDAVSQEHPELPIIPE